MKHTPSTQALRALDSFARHGSVWRAAQELNLTRSAVSHQLRLLERDLGFAMFTRVGTGIELTPKGAAFAGDVATALALIHASAARNASQDLTGHLTISSTPGFAVSWLGPKLEKFRAICPEITLSIITPDRLDDISNPAADAFITFARGHAQGVEMELLQQVSFTPLISPVLLNRLGGVSSPGDVLKADLLHLGDTANWQEWLTQAGVTTRPARPGIVFSDMNLVYTAAIKAQGIAMGDELTCREAMENGQLLRPFDLAIQSPDAYYLAIPAAKAGAGNVQSFRRWILDEVAAELQ